MSFDTTRPLVLCADLHFRADKPPCRKETLEEWIEVQFNKFQEILQTAQDGIVIVAGDFFHSATGAPAWLLSRLIRLIKEFPCTVVAIPGQHDLPYHQQENFKNSNLNVLFSAEAVAPTWAYGIEDGGWGVEIPQESHCKIAAMHRMVIASEHDEIYPHQLRRTSAQTAEGILNLYPNYDLIVTGDNHKPFMLKMDGRYLINPGSMTRQKSNETHAPGFFRYSPKRFCFERIMFKYDEDALINTQSTGHNLSVNQIDQKAVEQIIQEMAFNQVKIRPEYALQSYFLQHKTRQEVQEKIFPKV